MRESTRTKGIRVFLIALLMSFSIMLVPFQQTVSAASTTYAYGFENGIAGTQVTLSQSGFFKSARRSGVFNVTSTDYRSGLKMFYASTGSGWWNFSYSDTSYLSNFSAYIKSPAYTGGNITMFFYNHTHQSANITYTIGTLWKNKQTKYMVVLDLFSYGDNYMRYTNEIGSAVVVNSHIASTWSNFYFSIKDILGNARYSYRGSNVNGVACNPTAINNGWRIDRMFVWNSNALNYWYIDDINFTISTAYGGGAAAGSCDMTGYTSHGGFSSDHKASGGLTSNYLKIDYKVPLKTTIKGFEIYIASEMGGPTYFNNPAAGSGLLPAEYGLYINELYVGAATEVVPFAAGYLVKFCGFSVVLNNESITFAVASGVWDGIYGHWYAWFGHATDDLDGDGDTETKFSNDPGGYTGTTINYDVSYAFFTTTIIVYPETSPFTTLSINTNKASYTRGEVAHIAYFLNNSIYSSSIQVWHNGTQVVEPTYPFPYSVPAGDFSGLRYYVLLDIGNYMFAIYRNSVRKASVNVTVTRGAHDNFLMWSYPNPNTYGAQFTIGVKYYNPTGGNGMILIDTDPSMNLSDSYRDYTLSSNTTTNHTLNQYGNYYIQLYYSNDNIHFYHFSECDLYQQLADSSLDSISVKHATYTLTSSSDSFTQEYIGYHSWLGWTVNIVVNNNTVAEVGSTTSFKAQQTISTAGYRKVMMYVVTTNGTRLLAQTSFTVTTIPSGGGTEQDQFDLLFGPYKFVFAIGIIIMFVIMPMVVASRLGMELPLMVNLASGALGMSFVVLAGLIPQWVVFFTVVAMVSGGIIYIFMRG
jgi:hypothetical protein